ncbi:MAG TPA: type I secretion system permease/ATPase [Alphaproteobacteria bacterium]|nr:type I secretion system permease/ATPase [Alphaproteobacteria bacterium]USO05281.1 MAG: type I secretion system permease/ATPase [Rhodospirillales bacterium]HOO80934.1 type I secretion system permease/ATPase [Alphaproteobacteria bacterium]
MVNDKSSKESKDVQEPQDAPDNGVAVNIVDKEGDPWPLQADRMAIRMPLVDCLRIMAGHYGRRTSNDALVAGLPIPNKGITPSLFIRAAERAGMQAHLADRSLDSLAIAPNLPCILALEEGQACILWDIKYPEKHTPKKRDNQNVVIHPETAFIVQFPETPDERQKLTLEQLKNLYSGYAFFIRPVARVDDRAGPAEIDTGRDWFWSAFWKNKTLYKEVAVAAIMINMFGIAGSLFIMNVYDRVVPNNAFETLWVLAAGILIVYFFDFMLRNLRAHFLDYAGRKADVVISSALFEQMMGMSMEARPASAGVLAANMKEFETLRDFFTSATMVALIDLPFVLLFIAIIAVLGGPIAFVPLAAIPLIVGMGFFLQKPLQKVIKASLQESALKNALLFETIIGLETIKVQAAEGHTQRSWEELTDKASRTSVKSRQIAAFAQNWAMFVQQAVSAVIVIVGVYLIAAGSLSMGGLIACVILSGRAMGPLAQVAGLMTRFSQSHEALKQLDDLMKKPVERPAGKHFVTLPHIRGQLEFRDVVFHYPGQSTPALNHISLTIEPGEKVGIIGAVGSGKTTLERLLINLYAPASGSVQIDGTDVRQIDPGDLRRNVGSVQQSPQLFFGSVRQNITMGHETAPDRAVLRAAQLSGVMEFLKDSQAGLDTQVGERGEALSGGQRQAVAIARSLLYDPPILVLDEPTASMDPASENRLKKRLDEICRDKTVMLITHKGAMLDLVDKLILIDRGRLVAYGPKDEVIRKLQARQYGTEAENTQV